MAFDMLSLASKKPSRNLTKLEFLVLLSLQKRPLHGYAIMKSISHCAPKIKSGSMYPRLKRMARKGLVSRHDDSRHYAITAEGEEALSGYLAALREAEQAVKKFI